MSGVIYALCEPDSREIRYVGKTSGRLKKRVNEHLCRARKGERSHRSQWLNAIGLKPFWYVLEEIAEGSEEELAEAETSWIAFLRATGARLTNCTEGGEGCSGYRHTAEGKRKILAANLNNPKKGLPRPYRRVLTHEEELWVCKQYELGMSCTQISEALGKRMSMGGVRKVLIRHGIRLRNAVVGRWLTERAKPKTPYFSEDERRRILGDYAEGYGSDEIASKLGRPSGGWSVRKFLREQGIAIRNAVSGRWARESLRRRQSC